MPIALLPRAVQMVIAVPDHHAIRFDHQHAAGRVMLCSGRFVRVFNIVHAGALLALQLRANPFGLRA